jgi:hypothetical protein
MQTSPRSERCRHRVFGSCERGTGRRRPSAYNDDPRESVAGVGRLRNALVQERTRRTPLGDIGEEIPARETAYLDFFELSGKLGPGDVGTVFGGLVYYNFDATRFRTLLKRVLDKTVAEEDAGRAWKLALSGMSREARRRGSDLRRAAGRSPRGGLQAIASCPAHGGCERC